MHFRDFVPKKGWLRKYVAYGMGSTSMAVPEEYLNEIPVEFHLYTGLTVLGAALRRNVYLERGVYRIYPAMLTVLVAPTGRCRKTTSINVGTSILRASGTTKVISEWISPEALIVSLKQAKPSLVMRKTSDGSKAEIGAELLDACGIIIAPELSVFMNQADYCQMLLPLITRLADCPDIFPTETISRGSKELHNVAVSALEGTAPAWLLGTIKGVAFGGGFMARHLFVCRDKPTQPCSNPPCLSIDLKSQLVSELITMSRREGPIELTEEAQAWNNDWYNKFYYEKSVEEKRASFHERKQDHYLRIAMLLAVSKNKSRIDIEDLKEALALLERIEQEMFELFGSIERTSTVAGWAMDKVLRVLHNTKRISHTDLLRRLTSSGLHRDEVLSVLDTLIEVEEVIREEEAPSLRSRSKKGKVYYELSGKKKHSESGDCDTDLPSGIDK